MGEPTLHRIDDGALIARDRNLLIGAWWRSATVDHVHALRECTSQILADDPCGFASAVLVMDGKGVFQFSEDVRRGMTDVVRETETSGLGTALVVLRQGFAAAAVRAFLTGVFLLARSKEPQRAFADVSTAAAWLARCLEQSAPGGAWSTEDVAHTLSRVLAMADVTRTRSATPERS